MNTPEYDLTLFKTAKYYEDELMAKYGAQPFSPAIVTLMNIHLEQLYRFKAKTESTSNWHKKPKLHVDTSRMLIGVELTNET